MSGRPVMIDDLPTAGVDVLGAEDGPDWILGNAALAEILSGSDREDVKKPALELELDQLHELAAPAGDLMKVASKLAMAVRLAGWALDNENGYTAPLTALLGSALSDVIVLRHVELRRRELLAERAPSVREAEPAIARDLVAEIREVLLQVGGLVDALKGREPEPAAT